MIHLVSFHGLGTSMVKNDCSHRLFVHVECTHRAFENPERNASYRYGMFSACMMDR